MTAINTLVATLTSPTNKTATPAATTAPAAGPKLDNDGDYDNGAAPAAKVSLSQAAQTILSQK